MSEHRHGRHSEARFGFLVQNASDIIEVLEADGTVRYESPAIERVLGYRPEERVGKQAFDYAHEDDLERMRGLFAEVVKKPRTYPPVEFRVMHADGSWRYLEAVFNNLLDDPRMHGVVMTSRDVTERKRAEDIRVRRARQAELRADVSSVLAEDGALRGTLQRSAESVVRHLDAAFARIWTVSEEGDVLELQASAGIYTHLDGPHGRVPVGRFKIGLIAQERLPRLTNDVLDDPRVGDKEWARREGMAAFAGHPLLVGDRLVGVVAMFAREALEEDALEALASVGDAIAQAIERKRAEEEIRRLNESLERKVEERTAQLESALAVAKANESMLRESEARYERIAANAPGMVYQFVLRADGFVAFPFVSEGSRELCGLEPEEVQRDATVLIGMIHPEDRPGFDRSVATSAATLSPWKWEGRFITRAGETKWLQGASRPERQANDDILWDGLLMDVTASKRAEEEIRRLNAGLGQRVRERTSQLESVVTELEQAKEAAEEANRAKSEFLANMSHEIRTPMNGVIGMTGLLLDTGLTPEQREYAETVRASGESLLTIINDILDFSKIEAGKMELEATDFDLKTAAEESVGLLAERAHDKGLELAGLVYNDVPSALRGDPGRLRQVLVNLLSNAVKFTEEGEVVLRVGLADETETTARVRFEVRDTGIGMTEEQRGRIFGSFTQADASTTRRYGGTGLGLAISKQLVELMGGEVDAASELGKGSTLFFEVPFAKSSGGARAAAAPNTDLRGLRVLVVDDNDTNRKIVHHQVVSWGMRNGQAKDGPEALRLLRRAAEDGEPYDVAILDMQMPGMDGMELARRVKAEPAIAATRLIMQTSLGRGVDREEARAVGVSAYLTKPVRQSQLHDAIASAIGVPEDDASDKGAPSADRCDARAAGARSRGRVLVAEDNQVNQKVAVRMLERLGYRADVAADGLEAVEALSRVPYVAVLMDVQMPEVDGYEATAEIRRREEGTGRRAPVIAMTANAMEGDREKALEAGMDDYVPKPIKPEELDAVLGRWVPQEEVEVVGASITTAEGEEEDGIETFEETEGPLNRAVIENLLELGGSGMLSELAAMFFDDANSGLSAMREAIGGGNAQPVERIAHTLKGSSGSMGAEKMARICAELQEVSGGGDLSRAPTLLGRLEEELGRVRPALEAEKAGSGG